MSANRNKPEKMLSPIFCWDIYAMHLYEKKEMAKKSTDLYALQALHRQFNWQTDLTSLLVNPYEAIVVTDARQIIVWVNEGFVKMTDYPVYKAIGKTPGFLQGENTSIETKNRIKRKLTEHTSFSEDVINYRKNGEEYLCHVEIHPLINDENQLTHFLALEREIQLQEENV